MDLSLRGDFLTKPEIRPILHDYGNFKDRLVIPSMSLEEIMAEKIRGIMYTKHPRHLHDVAFLSDHDVKINPDMVRTKVKSAYHEEFDLDKFKDRVLEKEKSWKLDLQPLLPYEPPQFSEISTRIIELVKKAMS